MGDQQQVLPPTRENSYPKADVVYFYSISEQWLCQPKLLKSFDGFGLHAICFAHGRLVRPVVQDGRFDAKSDQVASMHESVFMRVAAKR
jgi:hypothetical protein